MLWNFALLMSGVFGTEIQSLRAPLRWMKDPTTACVITVPSMATASPLKLTVREEHSVMPHDVIPYFTLNPDKTMSWDTVSKCLEAGGRRKGAAVRVSHCTGGPSQRWALAANRHGQNVQLQDSNMCLAVIDEGRLNGAYIELRRCEEVAATWEWTEPVGHSAHMEHVNGFASVHSVAQAALIRHAVICCLGLVVLPAISLGAWSWRRQTKPRTVVTEQGIMTYGDYVNRGGVSMIATSKESSVSRVLRPKDPTPTLNSLTEGGRRFAHELLTREEEKSLGRKVQILSRWEDKLVALQKKEFASIDDDKNGIISPEEWKAAGSSREKFDLIDKDKSGGIDQDEFMEASRQQIYNGSVYQTELIDPTIDAWAAACGINNVTVFSNAVVEAMAAKQMLILSNQRLVSSLAKKFKGQILTKDDFLQDGTIGLTRAVDKWDPESGNKLSTYATPYILGSMSRAVENDSGMIRLPKRLHQELRSLDRARKKLLINLGRKPTEDEMMREMQIPKKKLRSLLNARKQKAWSIDISDSADSIDRTVPLPVAMIECRMLQERMENVLSVVLTPIEAQVTRLRFGLEDGVPRTVPQIDKILGEPPEGSKRVSTWNIIYGAMKKLRTAMDESHAPV